MSRDRNAPHPPAAPQVPPGAEPIENASSVADPLREARIGRAGLAGAQLRSAEVLDVDLRGTDLANADLRGASLRRVSLRGCRLTGALLTEANLQDVTFTDCRADMLGLARVALRRVVFTGCDMRQADLQEARMESVVFVECDLSEADLTGARMARCELRGCRIGGLRGASALRGARIPWPDVMASAAVLAGALGIEVLDAGDD